MLFHGNCIFMEVLDPFLWNNSPWRLLQPTWTDEGQRSIEIQINRNKTLSKFSSFFTQRVSPRVFMNQISSSRLSRLSPSNKDPESEPEDNSCSMSTSDSDAELE
nr:putative E3 ubiquitin-protein ligase LIN [Tanacetum cinerariifolium]